MLQHIAWDKTGGRGHNRLLPKTGIITGQKSATMF